MVRKKPRVRSDPAQAGPTLGELFPESVLAQLALARRAWARVVRRFAELGKLVQDDPVLRDAWAVVSHETPEHDRVAALARLAQQFPRPVARERWAWVAGALEREAAATGSRPTALFAQILAGALLEAAGKITPAEGAQGLHQRLNELITADLLGPEWRQLYGTGDNPVFLDFDDARDQAASVAPNDPPAHAVEQWLAVLKAATPTQRRLLDAWYAAPLSTLAEVARACGIKPNAANQAMARLRRRIG